MKPSLLFRRLARWHRWIGLAASLFVVWLVATGLLIHHADDFGLDRASVRSEWVLDHYRIGVPATTAFQVGDRWVTQAGKSLYVNEVRVADLAEPIVGTVMVDDIIFVASASRVLLFDRQAALIESLAREHGLPPEVRALGRRGDQIVIESAVGSYAADPQNMEWRRVRGTVSQIEPSELPAALKVLIEHDARTREISRERLLRDLHSGSFFGTGGRWLVDIAALALLILTATGISIWLRARREFGGTKPTKGPTQDRVRARLSR